MEAEKVCNKAFFVQLPCKPMSNTQDTSTATVIEQRVSLIFYQKAMQRIQDTSRWQELAELVAKSEAKELNQSEESYANEVEER